MWQYNELYHHGILGQKWGVRRYQNPDGSLTEVGRKRYLPDHTLGSSVAEYKLNSAYLKQARRNAARYRFKGPLSSVRKQLFYTRAQRKFEKTLEEIGSNYIVDYDDKNGRYLVRPFE